MKSAGCTIRCRMIVANFLTKDLLVNPQLGEKYFYQRLIDGDLSSNNGGWQWSASSGMDPKPVRIFNQPVRSLIQKVNISGNGCQNYGLSIQNSCSVVTSQSKSATLLAIQLRLWITNNSSASLKRSINSKISKIEPLQREGYT